MESIIISFLCFLSVSCFGCSKSQENIKSFTNITWETSLDEIISIAGLPESIYNVKYNDNITSVKLVWINPVSKDQELLDFGRNNNIQIEKDINIIFNKYNTIRLQYTNINFYDFKSKMTLEFNNKKLVNYYFQIDINDRSNTENISYNILECLMKEYGPPNHIQNNGKTEEIIVGEFLWFINNTEIVLELQINKNKSFDNNTGIVGAVQDVTFRIVFFY